MGGSAPKCLTLYSAFPAIPQFVANQGALPPYIEPPPTPLYVIYRYPSAAASDHAAAADPPLHRSRPAACPVQRLALKLRGVGCISEKKIPPATPILRSDPCFRPKKADRVYFCGKNPASYTHFAKSGVTERKNRPEIHPIAGFAGF